jgi:hypothetical protein
MFKYEDFKIGQVYKTNDSLEDEWVEITKILPYTEDQQCIIGKIVKGCLKGGTATFFHDGCYSKGRFSTGDFDLIELIKST